MITKISPAHKPTFSLNYYCSLLESLLNSYKFISYEEIGLYNEPTVIWRHDVDASIENAYNLAQIEEKLGIQATYFFMLGNWFYDVRDQETNYYVQQIKSMGHNIALHYDFEYLPSEKVKCLSSFTNSLTEQRNELEKILKTNINIFSFHNPTGVDEQLFNSINNNHMCASMINTYSTAINNTYKYCSDSNGFWRHDILDNLINPLLHPNLHILTHPEWWDNSNQTPRNKIKTILFNRATKLLERYDNALNAYERENF